jgi:hypothetical protein
MTPMRSYVYDQRSREEAQQRRDEAERSVQWRKAIDLAHRNDTALLRALLQADAAAYLSEPQRWAEVIDLLDRARQDHRQSGQDF